MFRFIMPNTATPVDEQVRQLRAQGAAFLSSEALRELLSLVGVDRHTIGSVFDGRRAPDGRVRETQELDRSARLEDCRDKLYPLFAELGFFGINEPLLSEHSRVLVLGGSLDACAHRTLCAKRWVSPSTRFVDGLACFRPVSPRERAQAQVRFSSDTEFGALSDCLASTFGFEPDAAQDDFCGDRNLNGISCVRTFGASAHAFTCRVFAAPSTQPELRRADTGDSILFYLQRAMPDPTEPTLVITDNRHCNRQFLQIAYQLLRCGRPLPFDIVGCTPDECVVTQDRYDPFQFVQDLIGTIDWIERVDTEL